MAADSNRSRPQPAAIWESQAQPAPFYRWSIWTPQIANPQAAIGDRRIRAARRPQIAESPATRPLSYGRTFHSTQSWQSAAPSGLCVRCESPSTAAPSQRSGCALSQVAPLSAKRTQRACSRPSGHSSPGTSPLSQVIGPWPSNPLAFLWKKQGFSPPPPSPKKKKGFSLRGTPKILGKGRKNAPKSKENRKTQKKKKKSRKKQGFEGQGGCEQGSPLQNLVMKFFPEFSPGLLCRAVGFLGWSFCWSFLLLWMSHQTSPKTSAKTSPRTAPLQMENFAQNFVLQKPFANHRARTRLGQEAASCIVAEIIP